MSDKTGMAGEGPRDPEELEAASRPTQAEISALTTLGPVHLSVSDLKRSLDYYQRAVGLELQRHSDGSASLGAGGVELVVLIEERDVQPSTGFTGLYHFALLVPRRVDLARWLAHASRDRIQLVGVADHFVSEALYLSDPDAHGIEIYWDRPREVWEGRVASRMTTLPLDIEGLIGELDDPAAEPFESLPPGTVMGHVHLKVAAIPQTIAFYRDILGLALMAQLGQQAAFLSAGGYHHHFGANTWESRGADPAPPGTATLLHATIVLPDAAERERVLGRLDQSGHKATASAAGPVVRDPSGNRLLLAIR